LQRLANCSIQSRIGNGHFLRLDRAYESGQNQHPEDMKDGFHVHHLTHLKLGGLSSSPEMNGKKGPSSDVKLIRAP
jgi:hypothetical protein